MKVLLVEPPIDYPSRHNSVSINLGLLSIASYASRVSGIAIEFRYYPMHLYDYIGKHHDFTMELKSFSPDVVCLSAITASYPQACDVARKVKSFTSDIITVLGGVFPSIAKGQILQECEAIDFVVAGEGEKAFTDFLTHLQNRQDPGKVAGVYKRTRDSHSLNLLAEPIALDQIGIPMLDIAPMEIYGQLELCIPYEISRGCPYGCKFCYLQDFSKPYRYRSPEVVVSDLTEMRDRFGIRKIFFCDDTGLPPRIVPSVSRDFACRSVPFGPDGLRDALAPAGEPALRPETPPA